MYTTNQYTLTSNICVIAAEYGHLHLLKWFKNGDHNYVFTWSTNICEAAIQNGHLHILKWLHRNKCSWNYEKCVEAVKNHPNILAWLSHQKN